MRRISLYSLTLVLAAGLACAQWYADRIVEQLIVDSDSPGAVAKLPHSAEAHAHKLLIRYCQSCHSGGRTNFDFEEASLEISEMRRNRETWELAAKKLRAQKMPPRKSTQPTEEERTALLAWLEEAVLKDGGQTKPLLIRRLQRAEYWNAVRDLFGMPIEPVDFLPPDETTWAASDQFGDLSDDHVERYRSAARAVLEDVLSEERFGMGDDEGNGDGQYQDGAGVPAIDLLNFTEAAGDADVVREILAAFARRAYRGAVETAELDRLIDFFDEAQASGATFPDCLGAALEEILVSPRFLFRVQTRTQTQPSLCGEIELASRLSFFLWNSAPDAELLDHAQHGTLRQHLEPQVRRMLREPRSKAMARDFATAWLGLDKLNSRKLNAPLRHAMMNETQQFVAEVFFEDRNVLDLVDADFTYLNETLARHYGLPGVTGNKTRRVSLKGTCRGGLIVHASILTLTTKTEATAPVLRGKWVLETLLGETVASPPPEALGENRHTSGSANIVFQNPTCAQCHARTDPIGLTLENFDPRGAWRDRINTVPINAQGTLTDGTILQGPSDLKAYLRKRHRDFVRTLSEKLLSYACSRKLSDQDRQALTDLGDRVADRQFRFSQIVLEVVRSEPFQRGRAELPGSPRPKE